MLNTIYKKYWNVSVNKCWRGLKKIINAGVSLKKKTKLWKCLVDYKLNTTVTVMIMASFKKSKKKNNMPIREMLYFCISTTFVLVLPEQKMSWHISWCVEYTHASLFKLKLGKFLLLFLRYTWIVSWL